MTTTTFDVQERFVPTKRVMTLTRRLYVADLEGLVGEALNRLFALVGERAAGAGFVTFQGEVNADSDGPVEVCVPFAGGLVVSGDVTVREEPAHHEACVTLTRAQFEFPDILRVYDATSAYAQEHGAPAALAPREVYPADWAGLS